MGPFIYFLIIYIFIYLHWASLVAQMVKNLPAMREEGMATHFSILASRIRVDRGA